jgi:tRNA-specific 2-thiouridylase
MGDKPRVLVGMSGGVDSSVAAALLADQGYEVTGATLKLWGGASDSGCCSVADVDDARRVADHLGIEHHVFNFGEEFNEFVVDPYVADHDVGVTPNPCIECNRHLKFDRFLRRADALGFDMIATGHHARRVTDADGSLRIARSADPKKDQSYVLHMLDQPTLARVMLPLGEMTKDAVRDIAEERGLRTANKPDSQDVCFITAEHGRGNFLRDRIELRPATVVATDGSPVGEVESVQLVTIGQRKGLGAAGGAEPRYVVDVDAVTNRVTIGSKADLLRDEVEVGAVTWSDAPYEGEVLAQTRAHGQPQPAVFERRGDAGVLRWDTAQPRVAPGQSVVLYRGDTVLGGAPAR